MKHKGIGSRQVEHSALGRVGSGGEGRLGQDESEGASGGSEDAGVRGRCAAGPQLQTVARAPPLLQTHSPPPALPPFVLSLTLF